MDLTVNLPFFTRNGQSEMGFRPITLTEFRALPAIDKDADAMTDAEVFKQRKALILTCTDLTEAEFNELTAPDFNELYKTISDFILQPADEMNGTTLTGKDFEFELLFPFINEVGEPVKHITFNVPKVKHSEALAVLKDDTQREDFMFRVVCGLAAEDLGQLALNDYLALKPQVGAFFQLAGDYFHQPMLKP